MTDKTPVPPPDATEDPVVTSARKEAIAVLTFAAIALTYTVVVCHSMGYGATGRELKFVRLGLGIAFPDWIFWGIIVPWLVCFGASALFAFVLMKDADLGEELEEEDDILGGDSQPTAQAQAAQAQAGDVHAR